MKAWCISAICASYHWNSDSGSSHQDSSATLVQNLFLAWLLLCFSIVDWCHWLVGLDSWSEVFTFKFAGIEWVCQTTHIHHFPLWVLLCSLMEMAVGVYGVVFQRGWLVISHILCWRHELHGLKSWSSQRLYCYMVILRSKCCNSTWIKLRPLSSVLKCYSLLHSVSTVSILKSFTEYVHIWREDLGIFLLIVVVVHCGFRT